MCELQAMLVSLLVDSRFRLIDTRLGQGWCRGVAGMCKMMTIASNVVVIAPRLGLVESWLGQG